MQVTWLVDNDEVQCTDSDGIRCGTEHISWPRYSRECANSLDQRAVVFLRQWFNLYLVETMDLSLDDRVVALKVKVLQEKVRLLGSSVASSSGPAPPPAVPVLPDADMFQTMSLLTEQNTQLQQSIERKQALRRQVGGMCVGLLL